MKNLFTLLSYMLYIYKRNQLYALLLQSIERLKGKVPGKFLGNKTKGEELHFFDIFNFKRKKSEKKSNEQKCIWKDYQWLELDFIIAS